MATGIDEIGIALLPYRLRLQIVTQCLKSHFILLFRQPHVLCCLFESHLAKMLLRLGFFVEIQTLGIVKLHLLVKVLLLQLRYLVRCLGRTYLIAASAEKVERHLYSHTHSEKAIVYQTFSHQFASIGISVGGSQCHIGQIVASGQFDVLTCQFCFIFEDDMLRAHPHDGDGGLYWKAGIRHHIYRTVEWQTNDMTQIHQSQLVAIVGFLDGKFRFVQFDLHFHDVVAGAHAVTEGTFHVLFQFLKQSLVTSSHFPHILCLDGQEIGFMGLHHNLRLCKADIFVGHVDSQFRHLIGCCDFTPYIDGFHHGYAAYKHILDFPLHRL